MHCLLTGKKETELNKLADLKLTFPKLKETLEKYMEKKV